MTAAAIAPLALPLCRKCGEKPVRRNDSRCHRCASPSRYGVVGGQRANQKAKYRRLCAERIARLQCEFCQTTVVVKGQLQVDHIDGDHSNDNPGNLQVLCANCHVLKGIAQGDLNGHRTSK